MSQLPSVEEFIEKIGDNDVFDQSKIEFIKNSKLMLHLTMIATANTMSKRVFRLRTLIDKVEDKLLDDSIVDSLDTKSLIGFYNTASETSNNYIKFISDMMKNTNWGDIESMLLELKEQTNQLPDSEHSAHAESVEVDALFRNILKKMSSIENNSKKPELT